MKRIIIYIILACVSLTDAQAGDFIKREFRGAWLHTVFQDGYRKRTTAQNRAFICRQLDSLRAAGVNAVIFQVRPQADAFYKSSLEPWSRFLTDGGKAPSPYWDPLEFIIKEAHDRGMELHAWLNPYRVTTAAKQVLPKGHIYHKHPERFVRYGGKLYFDPGIPENREFIGKVVDDIVTRYDIDGIHFDDYFYPYPIAGKQFPDDKSYARYGKGMKRDDWRRKNVDLLVEDINRRIKEAKPWVRFGVSPFGIWRNQKSDPRGSRTSGLQNYDALYADVLLWEEKGWVDYLIPQLYWELDHKAASYRVLVDWWNSAGSKQRRHLYIGQDVARTMNKAELSTKIDMTRRADNVSGNCWWPGYDICKNVGGVADSLMTSHQRTLSIVPEYPWISSEVPAMVSNIRVSKDKSLTWELPELCGKPEDAVRFVVYRFESLDDSDRAPEAPEAIVAVTPHNSYHTTAPGVYIVTALSRTNNESEPSLPVIIK